MISAVVIVHRCIFNFQDGSVYDGMWDNDKLDGYGTLTGPPDARGVCPQQYAGGDR